MITVVYYIVYLIQGITAGAFMHLCLKPKYNKWICFAAWAIAAIWQPLGRVVQMTSEDMKSVVVLSGFALFLAIVFIFYSDPKWKKITVVFLTLVAALFSDCIILVAFYLVDPSYLDASTEINMQTTIIAVSGEAGLLIVYLMTLFVWHALSNKVMIKGYLPTLLLPISQLCFSVGANLRPRGDSSTYSVAFFVGEILGFVMDIYWMFELLYRSRRAEAQHELEEIKHAMEIEKLHYEEIERKREDMAKIRHDINNQIMAARHLISEGENKTAAEMLDNLSEAVLSTREYVYCSIPIVNAVLGEKEQTCREEGIELKTNISISDELKIDNVMLCSLFGNLLDNAIRAVKQLEKDKRSISVSALTEGGLLVVKTVNPSNEPEKIRPGHGRGSIILQEIARSYNGSYSGEFKDNIFTAIVSMEVSK